jgi:hypothetical protein
MRNSWFFPVFCAVLILTCIKTPVQTTGSVSETDTAMIYNPDNTPAVGAVVRFFVATDSTRTVAWSSITDAKGHYSVSGLAKGTYNMLAYSAKGLAKGMPKMLTANDSLIAYQDSILVLADTVLVNPDTLEKPGSITGIIGLQPNHDPRTVTVQVLGTDLYSNVDANGMFTLAPVARGSYNLRLVTTLADYTPTYVTIQTAGQKKDTLSDTLRLLYTGIPVVTGLSATYDTVSGVVHLSWNKASYRDFQDYLIFKDPYGSVILPADPIAASSDTFFADTIHWLKITGIGHDTVDTNDYRFKYRVCVENNSGIRGNTYKYVDIIAASPRKVETSFSFTTFHLAKQVATDSASVNDSLLFSVRLANPTRQLRSLVWTDIATGKTVRTVSLDSTKKTAGDSLAYAWNSVGEKGLECVVTDMAGTIGKDTAKISIVKDAPVVSMTFSPDTIATGDTIHLYMSATRKYGTIVKVEWDIGNTGSFSLGAIKDSVTDTVVSAPGVPDTGWLCVVRVTDDDGNVVLDTLGIKVNMFKLATTSAGFSKRSGHSSVVFNNMMWVIGGGQTAEAEADAWYSQDGISWLPATTKAAFPGRSNHTSLTFNNKMWVIGGFGFNGQGSIRLNDVWSSSDGSTWTQSTSSAQFSPRSNFSCVSFNNKMWVIGGVANSTTYNDVWYSTDGVTWTQATPNAEFSPRSGHSSVVFDNKMWVIAGADSYGPKSDAWYSTDGVTWIQASANAGFLQRFYHSSVVFDNKMWVISGTNNNWEDFSDAWYTTDGVTWVQAASNCGFSPRVSHSSLAFGNKMWVIAGYALGNHFVNSEVWYSNFKGK